MARISASEAGSREVLAFLDLIAWSEIGPAMLALPQTDDGYRTIVGSTPHNLHTFQSYADHPRVYVSLNDTLRSSAAGRYQFIVKTWDSLAKELHLPDFSPHSQDLAAVELLRQCKAYPYARTGDPATAIRLASSIWASFPGNDYNQPQHKLESLTAAYQAALKAIPEDFSTVVAGVSTTAEVSHGS